MSEPEGAEAVPSDLWTAVQADGYDDQGDPMFDPVLLERTTTLLAELAHGGRALEFAIGTGRVALPLRERGVEVVGIEYSPAMAEVLRAKTDGIPVLIGDMATTRVPPALGGEGGFALVYLVFNTIGNLFDQDAQVECFRNAARHLAPGGHFVIENGVPQLRRMPPGQSVVPFDVSPEHLGFDEYDLLTQRATSHHYTRMPDGHYRHLPHHFRYVWPSELDLMARLADLESVARYADWTRAPFTAESESHVSVWRKPLGPDA